MSRSERGPHKKKRRKHQNRYMAQSKIAQATRRVERSCLFKASWDTVEEATQKGQTVYQCRYCGKYHRTSKKATY